MLLYIIENSRISMCSIIIVSLPDTNIARENDPWKRRILLETSIFELLVLGRVTPASFSLYI